MPQSFREDGPVERVNQTLGQSVRSWVLLLVFRSMDLICIASDKSLFQ